MDLKKLISQGESETLEFKKSVGEWKEIVQTTSAFVNTKGGIIIVGINSESEVTGTQIGKRTIEDLANKIKENTDPKIFPRISVEKIERKDTNILRLQ